MMTIPDGKRREERVLVNAGLWRCPECSFRREYATKAGALEGATKHMLSKHRVRLILPRSQPLNIGDRREP